MPVAHIYLTTVTAEQERRLLEEASVRYAEALASPLDRVRIFVHRMPPDAVAVGGRVVADGAPPAPFFTALVLRGLPLEHRHRLLAVFTDLLEEILGADRSLIRGLVTEVDPDGCGIAGRPASAVRAAEIAARAAASG